MTIEDDIAFLERVPTLHLLSRQALRILAIGAQSRYVHGGEILFNAGEEAEGGYVVQEGSFNLMPESAGEEKAAVVGPCTLSGEVALFTESQRMATATALEPSTVRLTRPATPKTAVSDRPFDNSYDVDVEQAAACGHRDGSASPRILRGGWSEGTVSAFQRRTAPAARSR